MLRRLYFVIPDESQAMQVMANLETVGVNRHNIHALPGHGATLTRLPLATERQRRDDAWHLESSVWTVDMAAIRPRPNRIAGVVLRPFPSRHYRNRHDHGAYLSCRRVVCRTGAGYAPP